MQKILLVSNKNPFQYTGGVEIVCKNLAIRLNKEYEITVIYRDNKNFEGELPNNIKLFPIIASSKPYFGDIEFSKKINEVLHTEYYDFLIDNGALSFKVNKNGLTTKIISIAHGTNAGNYKARTVENLQDLVSKQYRGLWSKWQKDFYRNKCDNVVAISKKIQKEIIEYYKIPKNKIDVIDNGVSFKLTDEQLEYKTNKPFEGKVAFVSTDHSWKGADILEEIARHFHNFNFYIYGKEYRAKGENVEYIGMVPNDKINLEMLDKDIFFMPSKYEGQSLAMLDAMVSGQIIVTSGNSDPALDKCKESVFISPKNQINDYLNIFKEIEANPKKYQNTAFNNISYINEINWDNQTKKYSDLLKSL